MRREADSSLNTDLGQKMSSRMSSVMINCPSYALYHCREDRRDVTDQADITTGTLNTYMLSALASAAII